MTMKRLAPLLLCLASFLHSAAFAGPAADALGACLADNTTGKDRKNLAKWMFLSMSAHPEMQSLSSATPEMRAEVDREMAQIVTRLLTESCLKQTKEVQAREGQAGLTSSFEYLGRIAMGELMSSPQVTASVRAYGRYLDKKKFESALGASK